MVARPSARILCCVAILFGAGELSAQLRPLEPLDWSIFESGRQGLLRAGMAGYVSQRASLTGIEGHLLEVGNIAALWRRGDVAFEAGGTLLRWFDEETAFAPPVGGARESDGRPRRDVGDFWLATILRLFSRRSAMVVLRFGTRLPTTDNGVGLERDQTDFFALVGGRGVRGRLVLGAEGGLGIYGTRNSWSEQADVLVYAVSVQYRAGPVVPSAALVGHTNWPRLGASRGNEDLREVRLGAQVGPSGWLRVFLVKGLTDFSPGAGLSVSVGLGF